MRRTRSRSSTSAPAARRHASTAGPALPHPRKRHDAHAASSPRASRASDITPPWSSARTSRSSRRPPSTTPRRSSASSSCGTGRRSTASPRSDEVDGSRLGNAGRQRGRDHLRVPRRRGSASQGTRARLRGRPARRRPRRHLEDRFHKYAEGAPRGEGADRAEITQASPGRDADGSGEARPARETRRRASLRREERHVGSDADRAHPLVRARSAGAPPPALGATTPRSLQARCRPRRTASSAPASDRRSRARLDPIGECVPGTVWSVTKTGRPGRARPAGGHAPAPLGARGLPRAGCGDQRSQPQATTSSSQSQSGQPSQSLRGGQRDRTGTRPRPRRSASAGCSRP